MIRVLVGRFEIDMQIVDILPAAEPIENLCKQLGAQALAAIFVLYISAQRTDQSGIDSGQINTVVFSGFPYVNYAGYLVSM